MSTMSEQLDLSKPREAFVCHDCEKEFMSLTKLRNHKKNSVCKNPHICQFKECSSVYSNIKELNEHIQDIHSNHSNMEIFLPAQEIVKNDKLNQENVNSAKLLCLEQKESAKLNSISTLFALNIERLKSQTTGYKNFSLIKSFDMKLVYEFRCFYCDSKYAQKTKFDMHVKQKHAKNYLADQNYVEPECKSDLKSKSKSKKRCNQEISHDEKETPFQCPYCARKFSQKHNINEHIKIKHKENFDSIAEEGKVETPAQEIDEKDKLRQENVNVSKRPRLEPKTPLTVPAQAKEILEVDKVNPENLNQVKLPDEVQCKRCHMRFLASNEKGRSAHVCPVQVKENPNFDSQNTLPEKKEKKKPKNRNELLEDIKEKDNKISELEQELRKQRNSSEQNSKQIRELTYQSGIDNETSLQDSMTISKLNLQLAQFNRLKVHYSIAISELKKNAPLTDAFQESYNEVCTFIPEIIHEKLVKEHLYKEPFDSSPKQSSDNYEDAKDQDQLDQAEPILERKMRWEKNFLKPFLNKLQSMKISLIKLRPLEKLNMIKWVPSKIMMNMKLRKISLRKS